VPRTDRRLRSLRILLLTELARDAFPAARISEAVLMMASSERTLVGGLTVIEQQIHLRRSHHTAGLSLRALGRWLILLWNRLTYIFRSSKR